jgi:hypothetical protein
LAGSTNSYRREARDGCARLQRGGETLRIRHQPLAGSNSAIAWRQEKRGKRNGKEQSGGRQQEAAHSGQQSVSSLQRTSLDSSFWRHVREGPRQHQSSRYSTRCCPARGRESTMIPGRMSFPGASDRLSKKSTRTRDVSSFEPSECAGQMQSGKEVARALAHGKPNADHRHRPRIRSD